MDILCERKTRAIIGEVRIGGYPKVQETFARVLVEESVMFSAWLRLPSQVDAKTKAKFLNEVIHIIELDGIGDALVGLSNISGLTTEQRN
ncbi:ABC transporter G family member 41, partial [Mucuna pruriens]